MPDEELPKWLADRQKKQRTKQDETVLNIAVLITFVMIASLVFYVLVKVIDAVFG